MHFRKTRKPEKCMSLGRMVILPPVSVSSRGLRAVSYTHLFVATVSGCNIRTDNPVFEFTNALHGKEWEDTDVGAVTQGTVLPYNSDICTGGEGNSFTFTTYARSIDFYYTGEMCIRDSVCVV